MTNAANGSANAGQTTPERYRIDVHNHFWVPKHAAERALTSAVRRPSAEKTPADAIEDMDRGGVATAMLSSTLLSVWFGDREHYRRVTRECNDFGAGIVRDYPGRFGLFAGLPLRDTEDSLREIEYAYDVLGADGVTLYTSYEDKWLGDPSFFPVMEELNRRRAVVYTHPYSPFCCRNLLPDINDSIIEYGTDTTRAIANVMFSGTAARYPDIRFIFSHGGGTVPYLYERLARAWDVSPVADRMPNGVLYELQKFYYDIAQAAHPMALAALGRLVPYSQILFGTDFPYRSADEYVTMLGEFFSETDLRLIGRHNALRLLPRLRAAVVAAGRP